VGKLLSVTLLTDLTATSQGAFHLWSRIGDDASGLDEPRHGRQWQPAISVGGHFAGVMDMNWDACGTYVLTVSDDQVGLCHQPS